MSPSLQTMGFFMSDINFCNTKEQLNHLGEVVTGKTNGSPSGADIDTSTLPYTGQVRKTLPALEDEYQADIDNFVQVSDQLIVDKTAEFDTSIANKEAEADAAIDSYRLLNKGPYASGITLESKFEYITYNGEAYFATNPPYMTTATTPDTDGNLFLGGYTTFENVANKIGNTNLLSNHNFIIQSPDAITHPNATPESYVAGTQIFSGVYAGDSGCTVTLIDGRVNCTAGDYQFKLPNTGGLERVPAFTSSVSDYDGIPKTTGVSHALVSGEYVVTVTPAAGDVFSVKLEQGSVATGHLVGANAKELAHAGDSQIVGGDIWPIDSNQSAADGDDLTGYSRLSSGGSNGVLYKWFPASATGILSNLDFNAQTATIGGADVILVVIASDTLTVDVSQFGIVPGIGVDNSDKFLSLREFINENRESKIEVNFTASGRYESRYSRWTWGARYLTINAYGAQFYNNDPNGRPNTIEALPLVTNQDMFQDYPYGEYVNTPVTGSLISTVDAGSETVGLINAGEISDFSVGDTVLVFGFDQQFFGFPPNARFYEYRKVESIGGAATLTLDRPLSNKYRDDWYEFVSAEQTPSKARVMNITRENSYFMDYLEINGLETVPNPAFTISQANGGIIGKNVKTLILNDCFGPYFANGENEKVILNRCKFDYFEPDKICNTVITNDCEFGIITQGTGVNLIEINRGEIWGRGDLSPKVLNLNSPLLTSENFNAMFGISTNMPTQSANIDVTCVPKATTEAVLSGASEVSITLSTQISGNVWEVVTNTAARTAIRGITTGTVLKNAGVNVFATVGEIYGNSNGLVIELFADGALNAGDVLAGSTVQELNVKRISQIGPYKGIPLERRSTVGLTLNVNRLSDNTGDGEGPSKTPVRTITYDPSLPQQYSEISGYIRKIDVWVKRAYTGSDVGKTLQVRSFTPAYTFANIDIYTVGNRTLTPTDTIGAVGTDVLAVTGMEYADKLLFNLAGGLTGSGNELPEIIVTFEYVTN